MDGQPPRRARSAASLRQGTGPWGKPSAVNFVGASSSSFRNSRGTNIREGRGRAVAKTAAETRKGCLPVASRSLMRRLRVQRSTTQGRAANLRGESNRESSIGGSSWQKRTRRALREQLPVEAGLRARRGVMTERATRAQVTRGERVVLCNNSLLHFGLA